MYGLSFMVKNKDEKKFFEYTVDFANPAKLNLELNQIIEERSLSNEEFDLVTVIHHNRQNTLVPQSLFDSKHAQTFLSLNVKLLSGDSVYYEIVNQSDMVNVYLPLQPLEINLNTLKLQHRHSAGVFLEQIHHIQSKMQNLPVFEIFLNVFPNDFQIAVFKNELLQAYNHFDFEETDDFLYYLFFMMETLGIDETKSQIYMMGVEPDHDLLDQLKTFTKNVNVLPPLTPSQINNYLL